MVVKRCAASCKRWSCVHTNTRAAGVGLGRAEFDSVGVDTWHSDLHGAAFVRPSPPALPGAAKRERRIEALWRAQRPLPARGARLALFGLALFSSRCSARVVRLALLPRADVTMASELQLHAIKCLPQCLRASRRVGSGLARSRSVVVGR